MSDSFKYDFSLVVPSYNEAKSLPMLIDEYKTKKMDLKFQLVVVDNGSVDDSSSFLQSLTGKVEYSFVKVVSIEKNIGYGNGIYQGLLQADAPVIGWTHADLQTPAEDPFIAYEILNKNTANGVISFVKGHRRKRAFIPKIITLGLQIFSYFTLSVKLDDINGQPKVFSRDLLNSLTNPPLKFSFDTFVQYKAIKNKYNVITFPVDFKDREFGVSSWANSFMNRVDTIKHYMIDIWNMRKS